MIIKIAQSIILSTIYGEIKLGQIISGTKKIGDEVTFIAFIGEQDCGMLRKKLKGTVIRFTCNENGSNVVTMLEKHCKFMSQGIAYKKINKFLKSIVVKKINYA